ncbi:bifunctional phosphopantothenoylcysteine decarboxylase/phosphopantothenate--cysteine ligase CoaBC [bacterium]|nr:MAG: bifunctional phosphopantothenoylcysteine decarboxylase/phosphopantothenate--cysteine ligase CoaBC [bacterium]
MLKGKKILIGITGGIAAYKTCSLVRLFIKAGAEVKVIMTPSAVKFVSPLSLSVLSKNQVIINMFPPGDDYSNTEKIDAGTWHINYGSWGDIFVIAPATANSIAKIANGISDNFLLSTVLASRSKMILVPAMDEDMFKNPVTQQNLETLRNRGFLIIEPVTGELASGLYGIGKMAEPEDIFNFTSDILKKNPDLKNKKVLITAGPTREPIDAVRYISNYSSGKMGFEIAQAALERGANVTLITGPVFLNCSNSIKRINVNTAAEMFEAVKNNLRFKDLVIMSAAVSDFSPVKYSDRKIKKQNNINLNLELEQSIDILKYAGSKKRNFKLIGFALETNNDFQNAKKKLKEKNADMIVLNNPKTKGAGFNTDTNVVSFIYNKGRKDFPIMSKYELGNKILDYYLKSLN